MDAAREVTTDLVDLGVAVVTIDRPERRNALGWDTWPQLAEALAAVAADDRVRAVVLTGAAGAFSAGGDVKSVRPAGGGVLAPAARLSLAHHAVRALARHPKPTVAAVEGYAIGAGWALVLACDLVVADRDAFFSAPFTRVGLVPDAGIGWFLSRAVGPQRVMELLCFGDRLPAPAAAELGLVNRLVAPGDARGEAERLAGRLASGPRDTLALTRSLVRRSATATLDEYLDGELTAAALNYYGEDAAEGLAAALEKREPRFPGGAGHEERPSE